jgi:hypothetical protein
LPTALQERDIRAALRDGGNIRGAFLVARRESYGFEFLAYLRPSWNKHYLPLRTFGEKSDRTYRDVGRLLQLICEDFGYVGPISIYKARSPELGRFKGVLSQDAPLLNATEASPTKPEPD